MGEGRDRSKKEASLHVQTKADRRVHEPFFLTAAAAGTACCFLLWGGLRCPLQETKLLQKVVPCQHMPKASTSQVPEIVQIQTVHSKAKLSKGFQPRAGSLRGAFRAVLKGSRRGRRFLETQDKLEELLSFRASRCWCFLFWLIGNDIFC